MEARRGILIAIAIVAVASTAPAGEIGQAVGSTISVVEYPARLCPRSNCGDGEEITRVPVGVGLEVEARKVESTPFIDVVWYRVSYGGRTGWVSEFTTDAAPKKPRPKTPR